MGKKEQVVNAIREEKISVIATAHITTNSTFLFIAVTLLTFVITIKNELFLQDPYLLFQLGLSIILFAYSIFARSKLIGNYNYALNMFGKYSFTLGLVAFMNSIGILMSALILRSSGLIFLIMFLCVALAYKGVSRHADNARGKVASWRKEIVILITVIIFGLVHILNYY